MKTGRAFLFLCVLLSSGTSRVDASSIQTDTAGLFAQGNSEYQKGNYASAERHYRRILDSGVDSGALYYNLGNVCFKQKRLGEAIYYWEKARQILPGDREIQGNLELANLLLVDRIETPAYPMPLKILAGVPELLTIAQESRLVLLLFVAANILFSVYLLAKNPRYSFRALIGCLGIGFLFIIFACSLSWKIYEKDYRREGVVIEQKVDVRSGPGPENITVFTIHEGIKVRVHTSSNGWYQISLPNGWNGWLRQGDLRIL
jgi:tetratricopeptide (TPR) repeat protein